MERNVIGLTSAIALLLGVAGFAGPVMADGHLEKCNVLLDGDGEPVLESDDDTIDHADSKPCAPGDEAKDKVAEVAVENVAEPSVDAAVVPTVEPLIVYFDVNSDTLSAGSAAQVASFAEQLEATKPTSINVVGYTDTSGSAALNEKLSKTRAANVVASLVDAGIAEDIITQDAVGEDALAVDTPDKTREPNNRRVIITPEY